MCKNTHETGITKQDAGKQPPSVQLPIDFRTKRKWDRLENLELDHPEPGSPDSETSANQPAS